MYPVEWSVGSGATEIGFCCPGTSNAIFSSRSWPTRSLASQKGTIPTSGIKIEIQKHKYANFCFVNIVSNVGYPLLLFCSTSYRRGKYLNTL